MSEQQSSCATAPEKSDAVEYRDIAGYPGYRVGNDGSLWSCLKPCHKKFDRLSGNWRRLRCRISKQGYVRISLCPPGGKQVLKYVHRLVLEAFVGPCPPGMEACHFPDNDPKNNRLDNLRWDTRSGNARDAHYYKNKAGKRWKEKLKLTPEQIEEVRARRAAGERGNKLAVEFGVTQELICLIHKRRGVYQTR